MIRGHSSFDIQLSLNYAFSIVHHALIQRLSRSCGGRSLQRRARGLCPSPALKDVRSCCSASVRWPRKP